MKGERIWNEADGRKRQEYELRSLQAIRNLNASSISSLAKKVHVSYTSKHDAAELAISQCSFGCIELDNQ